MTILDTSIDFFFANLFRDYLADDSSILAGIPDNTVLPKDVMDLGKVPDFPSVVVTAKEDGSKGKRQRVSVSVLLLTWLKAADVTAADVAEQTTSQNASGWINTIDLRLRTMLDGQLDDGTPVVGFRTWLNALPAERLAGWRITRLVNNGLAPPHRNNEKRTIFYATTLELHVVRI
jgi:hypothetical protein